MKKTYALLFAFIAFAVCANAQATLILEAHNVWNDGTGLRTDCEHTTLPFFESCDDFSPCWLYFNESSSNSNAIGPFNKDPYGNIFHFSSMLPASNFTQY